MYTTVLSHDGYDFPAMGDWEHFIHHQKYNCNYGSSLAPLDVLFGTYDDGMDVWDRIKRKKERMKVKN